MKFVSSLIGFAIGDAVGVPAEFHSREQLKNNPIMDMEEYGTHYQPKGTWSDDTSMTIATIDSMINRNCIDYNDIMENFAQWVKNNKYTATNKCFDVGMTCSSAIYRFDGNNALKCGQGDLYSNGNGSLMRILPLAFYCFYKGNNDNEILKFVKELSSLTHSHEISILGCYLYVRYIIFILNGFDKKESYKKIKQLDLSCFTKESIQAYQRILKKDIYKYQLKDIKSSGYVVDTLEAVFWTILNTNNYKDSILTSVNMGDDTDTVGAITGSLSGLVYGFDNIPNNWLHELKKKDELIKMATIFEEKLKRGEIQ